MPPKFTPEDLRQAARLAEAAKKEAGASWCPRFDPNYNLGHVVMTVSFLSSAIWVWHTGKLGDVRRDNRLDNIEESQRNLSVAMKTLSDNQGALTRSQDRLTWVIEKMEKEKKQ